MKIIIVTETFYPSINGTVTRLVEAIRYLKKAGHDVTVITAAGRSGIFEGADIVSLGRYDIPLWRAVRWKRVSLPLRRLICELEPDVVHIVNASLFGACGALMVKQLGIPLVMSHHFDIDKWLKKHRLGLKALGRFYWQVIRRLHNLANINLATSVKWRDVLRSHGIERVACLKVGVSTSHFHPRHADEAMRRQLTGGHEEGLLFLFVGKVEKEKQIDRLESLLQRAPDIHLAVIGDGPYLRHLRKLLPSDQVIFTGQLSGETLAQAYASADALVYPSDKADLALVILEGMASGLPVLAQDTPTMRLQIKDGETGYLVSFTNTDDLMEKINGLRDAGRLKTMSVAARHYAEGYSWTVSSQQLLDYYHLAIAHRRKEAFTGS